MNALQALWLALSPRFVFFQKARVVLHAKMPADAVNAAINSAQVLYAQTRGGLPAVAPVLRLVMHIMALDVALYKVLLSRGWSPQQAGECIAQINWALFEGPTRFGHSLSRLRSADSLRRSQFLVDWMFKLAFTKPFVRQVHASAEGVSFDVTRCAFAEYFVAQGVPELTPHAACQLDYRMSEIWGVSLHRSQTIAQGQSLCDFRYRRR
ncbi:MAG TPA: L-2-amino-thiazoline-4-carboxylic acid hydrolase [Limnobacter sp.]|nr:L-2-amino-thiazoline-4-carboxylic acid hydrolase [Limnobacter sp.]